MQEDVHPADGGKCYRYILLYVDNCLSIDVDAKKELMKLDHYYQMKPGSISYPDVHLGMKLKKTQMPNGVEA